jgi:hypothetical protein
MSKRRAKVPGLRIVNLLPAALDDQPPRGQKP